MTKAEAAKELGYDPGRDLRWLLLRPWVLIARLLVVIWQLSSLALVLVVQGNSSNTQVQQGLGRRILTTLTDLGPCFIKVGQALSTRPDLVRRDWLEQLDNSWPVVVVIFSSLAIAAAWFTIPPGA